ALANLDVIEREGLVAEADRKGRKLLAGLKELGSLNHVGDVRGKGLLAGVEFVEDKETKKAFAPSMKVGERVYQECVRRGLVSRFRGDIYVLAPPFVTTDQQIDQIVNILGEAITAVLK